VLEALQAILLLPTATASADVVAAQAGCAHLYSLQLACEDPRKGVSTSPAMGDSWCLNMSPKRGEWVRLLLPLELLKSC